MCSSQSGAKETLERRDGATVDQRHLRGGRYLDELKLWGVRPFSHELGVEGKPLHRGQVRAEHAQAFLIVDIRHR